MAKVELEAPINNCQLLSCFVIISIILRDENMAWVKEGDFNKVFHCEWSTQNRKIKFINNESNSGIDKIEIFGYSTNEKQRCISVRFQTKNAQDKFISLLSNTLKEHVNISSKKLIIYIKPTEIMDDLADLNKSDDLKV